MNVDLGLACFLFMMVLCCGVSWFRFVFVRQANLFAIMSFLDCLSYLAALSICALPCISQCFCCPHDNNLH
jgi:hypothetical protein